MKVRRSFQSRRALKEDMAGKASGVTDAIRKIEFSEKCVLVDRTSIVVIPCFKLPYISRGLS